jgi:hypothetical protein
METIQSHAFEAVAEEPASHVWAGRIRLHSAPGEQTDHLTEVGYFLVDARPETEEESPIQCFVRREFRSSRRAIAEAVRGGALAASLSPGAVTADVCLRFHWTTVETDREAAGERASAANVHDLGVIGGAAPVTAIAGAGLRPHVSYVPDTDERIPHEAQPIWRSTGPALFGKTIAALVFLAGVGLIALVIPHFVGVTGVERPPSAIPDLILGAALLVLALAFLVTERAWLMLLAGADLCMFAGGHYWINSSAGPLEIVTAVLGLLAGASAVLVRRAPRAAGSG